MIEGDKTRALEGMLCTGSHSSCHLHLTRGEFVENELSSQVRKARLKQRESNLKHYDESHARNSNLISKLERRIRNTMLTSTEATKLKSESGSLVIEKVWRNVYLNDDKVFVRTLHEKTMDLCVDIMLDGSASQMSRQESIAAQGYIIAESLTRCGIPVRVSSFCSVRDFLVLNVYRDYGDTKRNKAIFDYTVAGFNRDGLAIRTALHLAGEGRFQNRILIVLTDGDPNDMHGMSISGRLPGRKEYAGPAGVEDAAREVRKGIQSGIAVIGVFTGQDRNVEAAKKIYGRNFARISSPDKFADVVGVLLQNELVNMI
jgi:nitric oxide reductase activation protein